MVTVCALPLVITAWFVIVRAQERYFDAIDVLQPLFTDTSYFNNPTVELARAYIVQCQAQVLAGQRYVASVLSCVRVHVCACIDAWFLTSWVWFFAARLR